MYEPLVSIIIPVYNGSNYMREAIDSALSQTYKNIEILVINDGSKDGGATDEIARSYGDAIRYFSKENGGVSSALNKGISEMSGEYFSWLSHDDIYEFDKIEKQILALNSCPYPENTVICCNYIHINEQSERMSKNVHSLPFEHTKIYNNTVVLTDLLTKNTFNGCCLLIPKKIFEECGTFDERFRFCQDALMWYNIFVNSYSLMYIEDELVKNRIHSKQLTQTGQALFRKECDGISKILINKFIKISTRENNFLKMYILSDARYLKFSRVKEILSAGRENQLISNISAIKAYGICIYGYFRPFVRKMYYAVFKRVKTV